MNTDTDYTAKEQDLIPDEPIRVETKWVEDAWNEVRASYGDLGTEKLFFMEGLIKGMRKAREISDSLRVEVERQINEQP